MMGIVANMPFAGERKIAPIIIRTIIIAITRLLIWLLIRLLSNCEYTDGIPVISILHSSVEFLVTKSFI